MGAGNPAADVAHGALDTLDESACPPEELPEWARGCRVSLQYRVNRVKPTGAGAWPGQQAAQAGGFGGARRFF